MKRGQVSRPLNAVYLALDAKVDAYRTLWKRRIVLGWYPGKMACDAHLACFILENIHWQTGEFQSVAVVQAGGHSLRSLAAITGLPKSTVRNIIERWIDLNVIERYAIGEGRRGTLLINWHVISAGFLSSVQRLAEQPSAKSHSDSGFGVPLQKAPVIGGA